MIDCGVYWHHEHEPVDEHRAVSAAWRILQATDDESRFRAFARLQLLTDEATALHFWLMTKPDAALVTAYLDYRVLVSPMRNIVRVIV